MVLQHTRPPTLSLAQARQDFIGKVLTITGDTRLFFLPDGSDGATSTDKSLSAKTITHQGGSLAARLSRLGLGYAASFNGTSQYATVPDADNLSFGDGANDSAFSIVAVLNPSAQAAVRKIVTKEAANNNEFLFQLGSTDLLSMGLYDQSASAATRSQLASAGITEAVWQSLAGSYSGAGGGSASAGISLYRNGAAFASAASDSGVYTAMENLTANVGIGGNAAGGSLFSGSIAMLLICQKNLSASEHWALKNLINSYFALSL